MLNYLNTNVQVELNATVKGPPLTSVQTIYSSEERIAYITATRTLSYLTAQSTVALQAASNYLIPISLLAVVVVVSGTLILKRRKRPPMQINEVKTPESSSISTGYADLDGILDGGIPNGYAVVLVSPSYDERDLLLRRIVGSAISNGVYTYYVSNDVARTKDLIASYPEGLYALSSQANKIQTGSARICSIPSIENLSDATISLSLALKENRAKESSPKRLLIVDILSEIMIRYKGIVTRKWLSDFVEKRRSEGFTVLATLNPLIAAKQDVQTIVDFFDGLIEIYEKELTQKSRRFLVVKKMYGRKYAEDEILLDRSKLF